MPSQVGRGFGAPPHVELAQDVGHVVLDRLLGELQLFSNLPVGPAIGDELEDAFLLARQTAQAFILEEVLAAAETLQDAGGHLRVEQAPAVAHGSHRQQQLTAPDLLEHIP